MQKARGKDQLCEYLASGLPPLLPEFLRKQRWFGGKAKTIRSVEIQDFISVADEPAAGVFIILAFVVYAEAAPETYVLPLTLLSAEEAVRLQAREPSVPILQLPSRDGHKDIFLLDALWDRNFCMLLLEGIRRRSIFRGKAGEIHAAPTVAFERLIHQAQSGGGLEPSLVRREQSNTSVVYGDRFILKFFRRLEEGINLDVDLGVFLTHRCSFAHVPQVAGDIVYRHGEAAPVSIAFLQEFVRNQGDAWHYTLAVLEDYLESASRYPGFDLQISKDSLFSLAIEAIPEIARKRIGSYLDSAQLLGRRTADLHLALASDSSDPKFAPEPFSRAYRDSIFGAMCAQATRSFGLLRNRLNTLPEAGQEQVQKVLSLEDKVLAQFRPVVDKEFEALRIRIHGDFHLGQVLCANGDFVIIDFEGEPARPLSERQIKRSPLQDVAGMLRSFHYAAESALLGQAAPNGTELRDRRELKAWAGYWQTYVSAAFLKEYLLVAGRSPLLPQGPEDLELLLRAFQLDKAVYELDYELNNRPDWVRVPLDGIVQIVEAG